jgi:hypothetical protein
MLEMVTFHLTNNLSLLQENLQAMKDYNSVVVEGEEAFHRVTVALVQQEINRLSEAVEVLNNEL